MKNKAFSDRIFNELYSMFATASPSSMTIKQIEQLRVHAEKMANILSKQAKLDSIEMFEKLQNSILEAFKDVDKKLETINKRLDALDPPDQRELEEIV